MPSSEGSQPKKRSRRRHDSGRRGKTDREHVPWYVWFDLTDPSPVFEWLHRTLVGSRSDSRWVRRTRRWLHATLGLVVVLAIAGGVAWRAGWRPALFARVAPLSVARLHEQASALLAAEDYAAALPVYDQLIERGDKSPQARYERALCLAELDRAAEAETVMQELAVEPRPNFPLARLWLATRVLQKAKLTSEERDEATRHPATSRPSGSSPTC
jgi:hypothetical protein